MLISSYRYGVIFQDASIGQTENMNPLVREVIVSLKTVRPWEDVNLSNILLETVSACPDQLQTVLGLLEKNWEPRDSSSWLQVVDLLISIMERLEVAAMAASAPASVTEKILSNVLCPAKMVQAVITPGLSPTQSLVVRSRSCHLLAVILTNLSTFLSLLPGTPALPSGLSDLLTRAVDLWQLGELLPALLDNKLADAVSRSLTITKLSIKMLGVSPLEGINIGEILQTVQQGGLGEQGVKVQLQILELMNLMIVRSEDQFSPALREIYSADTFKLLLQIITNSRGEQKKSAVETFSGKLSTFNLLRLKTLFFFIRISEVCWYYLANSDGSGLVVGSR